MRLMKKLTDERTTMSEGKLITPKARIAFANQLFVPKAPKSGGAVKYGCTLIFDAEAQNSDAFKKLRAAVTAAGANERKNWDGTKFAELVKAGKVKVPFLKGDDNVDEAGVVREGFAGSIYVRPTSKLAPQIVDQKMQPITEATVLYSGAYVRASLGLFTYSIDGNRGISFGLRNVQKLADGPPLGNFSRAADDFEPVADAGGDTGFAPEEDLPY